MYAQAIDRLSFERYQPSVKPQDIAFGSVATSIAQWLHELKPPEGGLLFADHSRSEQDWEAAMESMRHGGFSIRNPRAGTTLDIPPLDYLADTMLFQHSKKSTGLQMADYVNFFFKMHMMRDKEAEPFYEIIKPLIQLGGIFFAVKTEQPTS